MIIKSHLKEEKEGIQMKNKILLVLGIIAAAIAIFYFILFLTA